MVEFIKNYVIIFILFSWYINAFADSIDHAKGGARLGLLWHLIKLISYILVYIPLLIVSESHWIIWITVLILGYGWEIHYNLGRSMKLYKYDDIDLGIFGKIIKFLFRIK